MGGGALLLLLSLASVDKRSSQSGSQSVSSKSLAGASDAYSSGKDGGNATKEGSTKLARISPFMIQHVKCVVDCYRRLKKMKIHKVPFSVRDCLFCLMLCHLGQRCVSMTVSSIHIAKQHVKCVVECYRRFKKMKI